MINYLKLSLYISNNLRKMIMNFATSDFLPKQVLHTKISQEYSMS